MKVVWFSPLTPLPHKKISFISFWTFTWLRRKATFCSVFFSFHLEHFEKYFLLSPFSAAHDSEVCSSAFEALFMTCFCAISVWQFIAIDKKVCRVELVAFLFFDKDSNTAITISVQLEVVLRYLQSRINEWLDVGDIDAK